MTIHKARLPFEDIIRKDLGTHIGIPVGGKYEDEGSSPSFANYIYMTKNYHNGYHHKKLLHLI